MVLSLYNTLWSTMKDEDSYPCMMMLERCGVVTLITPAIRPKAEFRFQYTVAVVVSIVSRFSPNLRRENDFLRRWRYTWKGRYQCWEIEQRTDPLCCSPPQVDRRGCRMQRRRKVGQFYVKELWLQCVTRWNEEIKKDKHASKVWLV